MAIDPYRVLGLPAGASAAEVKRAYRRLAKANHPDSAGAAALPRFLEIQRAYETLTSATWRPGMRRPSSGTPGSAGEPWRADPTRARSTPGAQPPRGAKPPPGGSGASSSGGGSASGGGAGSRTGGSRAAGSGPATGTGRASAGQRSKPGGGSRPAGAADGASPGRRRPSKKATFGSTTYDEAREGADTSWSGASWYGPSSGEYWRVNPREYADPRKHGPEYLARAAARAAERRARHGTETGDADGPEPDGPEPGDDATAAAGDRPSPGRRTSTPPSRRPAGAGRTPTREAADATAAGEQAWAAAQHAAGERAAGHAPPDAGTAGPWPGLDRFLSPGARRLLRALIAWPPLGIAAAAVIGESTGCAAFEATCTAPADLYPWFAQAAILLVLVSLPGIARVLAGGTVAVVVLAFPVAAALSASGATYDRTYGPAALIAVLGVVWVGGVAAVLLRRAVTRGLP